MSGRGRRVAWMALAVVALVAGLGGLFAWLPVAERGVAVAPPDESALPGGESAGNGGPAFDRLFRQGVAYMRQGRSHEAAVVFAAAERLQPYVAEAAVNLGFALLAQGQYGAARDAFQRALARDSMQLNAYYGLAEALEGLGDLEGALGAMRTYEHLAPAEESRFRRLAAAAIWEWSDQLRRRRSDGEQSQVQPDE